VKRRTALATLGGIVAGVAFGARAQKVSLPVIGFLNAASPEPFAHVVRAFRVGLNEMGYVEDRNVAIEYRWADDQYDRLPALAEDLVRRRVSVIATGSNLVAAKAAKAATTTIPIVFLTGADPVKAGLVASLARPGGNLTGITTLNLELGLKLFEVLHELVPTTTVIGVLINPINDPAVVEESLRQAQAAARALGLQMHVLHASTEGDVDSAFSTLIQRRAGGLVITPDAFFSSRSKRLAALALRHAMPTVSPYREFVTAGGLMSYGGSITDQYRLVGVYTGRILKGEKPAELPVHQVAKVEFVINMKTAKALGLTVPQSLLVRANEVTQ
jgi:putative tryptophan/tyrosine transport system substrate-binding protein